MTYRVLLGRKAVENESMPTIENPHARNLEHRVVLHGRPGAVTISKSTFMTGVNTKVNKQWYRWRTDRVLSVFRTSRGNLAGLTKTLNKDGKKIVGGIPFDSFRLEDDTGHIEGFLQNFVQAEYTLNKNFAIGRGSSEVVLTGSEFYALTKMLNKQQRIVFNEGTASDFASELRGTERDFLVNPPLFVMERTLLKDTVFPSLPSNVKRTMATGVTTLLGRVGISRGILRGKGLLTHAISGHDLNSSISMLGSLGLRGEVHTIDSVVVMPGKALHQSLQDVL